MDEPRTMGPRLEGRPRHTPTRWGHRTGSIVGAVLAVMVVAALVLAEVFGGTSEAAAQQRAVPPGLQPPVQSWLKDRERDLIELNNALVPLVQKQLKDPTAARAACTRLARVAHTLSARGAVPSSRPEIDTVARAGLATFERAAAVCLAGDVPGAERLVSQGLAERTAANDRLDALLDGE
jgi:hypothetical protein